MGSFISILLSYENLYEEDDIDNINNIDKYEFTAINNNEDNVPDFSIINRRCSYITERAYQDVGITFVDKSCL